MIIFVQDNVVYNGFFQYIFDKCLLGVGRGDECFFILGILRGLDFL